MGMQINFGNTAFCVPGAVVDHYMRLASETQLKVLLFLLRHNGTNVTLADCAAFLRITEEQAEEAVAFWQQTEVMHEGAIPASAFSFAAPVSAVPAQTTAPAVTAASEASPSVSPVSAQRSSKEIRLDPSEIAAEIEKSPELSGLFVLAEKSLGRPVNHMEQRSLLWLNQYLNIPTEVILMLIEFCVSIEKYSISYAESIAISWQSEGIVSLEQAEAEIKRMTREHTFTDEIRKRFELKRSPTTKQRAYLEQWQKASYPMELIQYAYEITVENIEKCDFKYIDTILRGWAESGIRERKDAEALREKPKTAAVKPGKPAKPMTQREVDKMNSYLSAVNRFKKEDSDE